MKHKFPALKREIRTFRIAELRASDADAKSKSIGGYAAVFNSPYEVKFGDYTFREIIKPGAFTRALKEKQDVRCLINHDDNLVLGRTKSGTLELKEDDKGLRFDVPDLPDTSYANDLHVSVKRGDIDQCSFAMFVTKQTRTEEKLPDGKGVILTRTIEDLDLFDTSVVTYPAYEDTSCEARSLFPDGIPELLKQFRSGSDGCQCDCPECVDGNCSDCSDEDCECEGCDCQQRSKLNHDAEFRERMELKLKLHERI